MSYTVLDQHLDVDFQVLCKISQEIQSQELLDALGSIELDRDPMSKMASDRFAYPEQRLFPIHDYDNVLLSRVYFDHQRDKLPTKTAAEISRRLDTYLDLHGIPDSLFCYQVKTAREKRPEPRFLLPEASLCKVAGASDLYQAQDLFDREHRKLPLAERVEFSQNFLKAARDFGCKPSSPNIAKYAAELDTDLHNTRLLLDARATYARRKGLSGEGYIKLASMLEEFEVEAAKKDLEKLAEVIHQLDQEHGLDTPRAEKHIPCAYSSVFNKLAEEADAVKPEEVSELTKAEIVAQYGEGILDEVEDEEGNIDQEKLNKLLGSLGAK